MIKIKESSIFFDWLKKLKDKKAKTKILVRLGRIRNGNLGDVKSVGNGIFEIRITEGKGYRIYYIYYGDNVIILLCGGNKDTQQDDIKRAQKIVKDYL